MAFRVSRGWVQGCQVCHRTSRWKYNDDEDAVLPSTLSVPYRQFKTIKTQVCIHNSNACDSRQKKFVGQKTSLDVIADDDEPFNFDKRDGFWFTPQCSRQRTLPYCWCLPMMVYSRPNKRIQLRLMAMRIYFYWGSLAGSVPVDGWKMISTINLVNLSSWFWW